MFRQIAFQTPSCFLWCITAKGIYNVNIELSKALNQPLSRPTLIGPPVARQMDPVTKGSSWLRNGHIPQSASSPKAAGTHNLTSHTRLL